MLIIREMSQSERRVAYVQLMALQRKADRCMTMLSVSSADEPNDRIRAAKELVKLMRQRRKIVWSVMPVRNRLRALLRCWF